MQPHRDHERELTGVARVIVTLAPCPRSDGAGRRPHGRDLFAIPAPEQPADDPEHWTRHPGAEHGPSPPARRHRWIHAKKVPATCNGCLPNCPSISLIAGWSWCWAKSESADLLFGVEVGHGHPLELGHRRRGGVRVRARARRGKLAHARTGSRRSPSPSPRARRRTGRSCPARHRRSARSSQGNLVLTLVMVGQLRVEVAPGPMQAGRWNRVTVREGVQGRAEPLQVTAHSAVDDLVHAHARSGHGRTVGGPPGAGEWLSRVVRGWRVERTLDSAHPVRHRSPNVPARQVAASGAGVGGRG